MANEKLLITDFELKEDLFDSFSGNPDIRFINEGIMSKAKAFPIGTLLEVKKQIGSPITILDVNELNEESVSSAFSN